MRQRQVPCQQLTLTQDECDFGVEPKQADCALDFVIDDLFLYPVVTLKSPECVREFRFDTGFSTQKLFQNPSGVITRLRKQTIVMFVQEDPTGSDLIIAVYFEGDVVEAVIPTLELAPFFGFPFQGLETTDGDPSDFDDYGLRLAS